MLNNKLLKLALVLFLVWFVLKNVVTVNEGYDNTYPGVFYDSGAPHREGGVECSCESCTGISDGMGRECTAGTCGGWNNTVSTDCRYRWAPNKLMGQRRVFKMPNYYGYGTGSGFHYGEPYYIRKVDY